MYSEQNLTIGTAALRFMAILSQGERDSSQQEIQKFCWMGRDRSVAGIQLSEVAKYAEFYSFGTNDMSQFVFGYSRDDAEKNFLLHYVEHGILPKNPFQVLDRNGVGKLMKICVNLGRKTREDMEIGVCGEHGGEPASIKLCHEIGLNYVSCSPFRVPVARLAAAHAALGV